jgi:DNA-binding transcriptional regulator YdaS (Cro superfamily)
MNKKTTHKQAGMLLKQFLKSEGYTQRDLAKHLNVTPGAVWLWINMNGIPPTRARAIEKFTGGKLKRIQLCPEIYKK